MQVEADEHVVLVAVFGGERHSRHAHQADGASPSGELKNLASTDSPFSHRGLLERTSDPTP
jgi:hypothetical protein